MSPSDAEYAAALVARRLGLPVNAALTADDRLVLTPTEINENDGFSVEVHTSWRTAEARFLPGRFARPLIERMGTAGPQARAGFAALATAAAKQGKLSLRVNGTELATADSAPWPAHWQKLELVLKKQGVVFEELARAQIQQVLGDIIAPMFGMCIALIGIEDVDADNSALEGTPTEVISRRYERRPVNREICLSVRGRRCYCCNMDFGEAYGPLADGYIEVHHTTPASEMGPGYKINPVTELVPICSNCHSAVHLTIPARSVDEVKAIFDAKRASNEH
jgi:5-methylcytosine-specific restriction protein A